ncbi:Heat shock protein Hsp20 [Olavius algarvensis associated proteobacterium Delta 3]|nr:Heat shock protein Hsp20 [Olavius algarvensis associated proteobacterium Delta 3]CAB5117339.1 Heat shock protein Hsp20 [Olavius algarvensis associated proteobacterium Delta 3]
MNLVRWNPWNDRLFFRNRFDRLFDRSLYPVEGNDDGMTLSHWSPVVDIFDKDDHIAITAEIPGVDKDRVSVDVKERVLTLRGERSGDNEVKKDNYYRRERVYGSFERSFTLPENVDSEKITAEFKDGVLTIEVPKPEKLTPKQITVH